ncbi:MAG: hypothetical protein CNIPEHKO_02945 [Anaerolineales bacterium]|nr:hypothetical protein [Anaerolineales bacterium]
MRNRKVNLQYGKIYFALANRKVNLQYGKIYFALANRKVNLQYGKIYFALANRKVNFAVLYSPHLHPQEAEAIHRNGRAFADDDGGFAFFDDGGSREGRARE